jgi:hypothetical protein
MADYRVMSYQGGEFGIRAESDRAGNRAGGRSTKGSTLGFKSGYEAVEFVLAEKREGYTLEDAELLNEFITA